MNVVSKEYYIHVLSVDILLEPGGNSTSLFDGCPPENGRNRCKLVKRFHQCSVARFPSGAVAYCKAHAVEDVNL